MRNWPFLFILIAVFIESTATAQLCNGSLSDPIISIDFNSGTSTYGPPLPNNQTTYNYVASPNVQDGSYTITTSPIHALSVFHNTPDHTPNDTNGYMLVVNADFTPGEFYRRRVTGLCENTIFEFSAWAMNVLKPTDCNGQGIDPNLRFEIRDINGGLIAISESGDIPESTTPTWLNFGITFDIGNNTAVDVIIINNAPGGCGNDLAIDDIEFRACGDTANITSDLGDINPFCDDEVPASLTLESVLEGDVYDTPFYQWETSSDGQNWDIIPGAVNSSYTVSPVVDGVQYRYRVAGSANNITNSFCSVLSDEVELIIHPQNEWQIDAANEICDNQDLELLVTGTAQINEVTWNLPNNNTTQGNPILIASENVLIGEYEAIISDTNGCKDTLSHQLLNIKESANTMVDIGECVGTVVQIGDNENYTITENETITRTIEKQTNGCDSTITYTINAFPSYNDERVDTVVCYNSPIIDPNGNLVSLTEDVTYNYSFLTENGCDSLVTKSITVPQPVDVLNKVCRNDIVNLPDGSQITAENNFEETYLIPSIEYPSCDSIINYTLDVGDVSEENNEIIGCPFQPVFLPDAQQTIVRQEGTYTRTFISENGCDSIINYIVSFEVDSCSYEELCEIRFPSAISPDGNNRNDGFQPLFAPICNYTNYELTIYNRWGERVFLSTDTSLAWQPNNEQNSQAYLWHVTYTLVLEDGSETPIESSGTVNLLK